MVSRSSPGNLRTLRCLAVVGLAVLLHAPVCNGGECLAGDREVKVMSPYGEQEVLPIRSFVCEVDGETDVRIEFHRLNDAIVGDLLEGRESSFAKQVLGQFSIHKNAVYNEVKTLFDRFGIEDWHARGWSAEVQRGIGNADGVTSLGGYESGDGEVTTFLGSDPERFKDFPLLEEMREARSGRNWFQTFKFSYADCPLALLDHLDYIGCLSFWRPMTRQDAEKYALSWKELNALLGAGSAYAGDPPGRDLDLFLYLTKESWPADFSYIVGNLGGHGIMQFVYLPRRLHLDIAVIENLSEGDASVDGLFGTDITDMRLRAIIEPEERSASRAPQISSNLGRLGPGEKLLVPLRILFSPEIPRQVDFPKDPDGDFEKAAWATYELIRAAQPGPQGFRYDTLASREEDARFITSLKQPEDFKEPFFPKVKDYAYGPEIVLRGIKVNGERLDLQGRDPNMLAMTTFCECGSCPYLHAWSDRLDRWVSYGKVIHEAQGAELQAEEEVNLTELATRFRIAERELELSHIDQVRLRLELSDGRTLELVPDIPVLNRVDGDYAEIYAGGSVEFEFALPEAIAKEDIRSSSLSVNGYYQLYTSPEMLARLPRLPVSE